MNLEALSAGGGDELAASSGGAGCRMKTEPLVTVSMRSSNWVDSSGCVDVGVVGDECLAAVFSHIGGTGARRGTAPGGASVSSVGS